MLILIGGVSRSGKSALADAIQLKLGSKCRALHQDEFALREAELPYIHDMRDWEVPESIDWESWNHAIGDALLKYEVVVAEGILAFLPAQLLTKADIIFYMKIDYDTYFARQKAELRWGSRPEWYLNHVWEAHFKYGLPPDDCPVIRLDGSRSIEENLHSALELIHNLYSK